MRPCDTCFLAIINHVMKVSVHVEQRQSECDVARRDVIFHGARVREGRRRLTADNVPDRLGQEHATHVTTPSRVVVPIKLIDGDLGGHVLGSGHRTWAHNLMEGMRLGLAKVEGEAKESTPDRVKMSWRR